MGAVSAGSVVAAACRGPRPHVTAPARSRGVSPCVTVVVTMLTVPRLIVSCPIAQMVHDYFLLGRGELFTAFLDDAQAQLSLPRTASSQYGG